MTEFRKAFLLSVCAVTGLSLWLSQNLQYLRGHLWIFQHGAISPDSRVTNLQALGIWATGIFLVIFMLAVLGLRRFTYRESGGMLAHGQREIPDLRGMEKLQKRLK